MGLCGVLDILEKSLHCRLLTKAVSIVVLNTINGRSTTGYKCREQIVEALDSLTREQIVSETRKGHCQQTDELKISGLGGTEALKTC
jgi:hypothetical protein